MMIFNKSKTFKKDSYKEKSTNPNDSYIFFSVEEMPEALKYKIAQLFLVFCFIGLIILVVILLNRQFLSLWICPAMMIVFGLVSIGNIIYNYKKDNIICIEGIIINKESSIIKSKVKDSSEFIIQDDEQVLYQFKLFGHQSKFKTGQTVAIYITKDKLNNFQDDVYVITGLIAAERTIASLSEEEILALKNNDTYLIDE